MKQHHKLTLSYDAGSAMVHNTFFLENDMHHKIAFISFFKRIPAKNSLSEYIIFYIKTQNFRNLIKQSDKEMDKDLKFYYKWLYIAIDTYIHTYKPIEFLNI